MEQLVDCFQEQVAYRKEKVMHIAWDVFPMVHVSHDFMKLAS